MDLLERYLRAVRANLPAHDADDILAELREVLLERVESREEALGRPLLQGEWESLLIEFGHPLTVAARYRPQQWLIGPEAYPFYLYFLKMIGGIVVAVVIISATVRGLTHHGGPGPAVAGLLGSLWWSVAATVGAVTIVFALLERYGGVSRHFQKWTPGTLPMIEEKPQKHWESMFEVAAGVVFLLWWTGSVTIPFGPIESNFRIAPAPIWTTLYWPILLLAAVRLAHNLIQWLRPGWHWLRGLLGISTAVAGIWLAAILYRAGSWAVIEPFGMPRDQAAKLQESLNLAIHIAILVVAVIWTLQCLLELWRWMRRERR